MTYFTRTTFITLVMCVLASLPLRANESERTVIVLFGDSITVGYNNGWRVLTTFGSTDLGCPTIYMTHLLNRLGQRPVSTEPFKNVCFTTPYSSPIFDANKETRNTIVASWGQGGSSTTRGVQRITGHLSITKNAHPGKAYLALILYGTNDQNFGISSTTTGFNTRIMIQRARAAGYTPIIGTLLPRDDRSVLPYNAQIVAAANAEGVFIVDHYARYLAQPGGWTTLLDREEIRNTGRFIRLHPNDHGYLVIAETWFDKRLRDIIEAEPNMVMSPILNLLLDE